MSAVPLNSAQMAAIKHTSGPALVLAGAGSGKTRVITQRISRLIELGIPAQTITALTFTNKAAEEMRGRLALLCGQRASKVWISTFHALGGEIVRREIPRGQAFVVYDGADQVGLVKELMRGLDGGEKKLDSAAIVARISHAKNALTTPDELPYHNDYDCIARVIFPRYEAELKRLHALDFDDLILWPLKLFEENTDARERWQRRIHSMLIDEFQDTNRAQLLLVKALVGKTQNVFCVGDDDQSIYGWRGADISNVIDFTRHFPGAKIMALEQNYRSRRPILEVSNAVMEGQVRAFPKKLFTDKPGGDKVQVVRCATSDCEARLVTEATQKLISQGYRKREIGVLYRSNALSRGVEETFKLANIPYRLIGGASVYERREVKDLIAYLRLAVHPADEIALRRVINYPSRGVGEVTLARIERLALARGATMLSVAEGCDSITDIASATRDSIKSFVKVIRVAREHIEANRALGDVARDLAAAICIKQDIIAAGPSPLAAGRRWANVEMLYKTLEKSEAKSPAEAREVLTRLTLHFNDHDNPEGDEVTLSTLHSAKGLEFGTVFFIGCDEGIIPHARTDAPKATDMVSTLDAGEERRLFYVGATRAKDKLYLTHSRSRSGRGAPRPSAPSRFLSGLPELHIERTDYDSQAPLAPSEIATQARKLREALSLKRAM